MGDPDDQARASARDEAALGRSCPTCGAQGGEECRTAVLGARVHRDRTVAPKVFPQKRRGAR